MYQHPGVYIEELPSGSAPIEAASTSTALIVGYAVKGPVGVPTLLFNFDRYKDQFGGIIDFTGTAISPAVDYMGHSVQAFFNNGGTKAYIVRLEGPGAKAATAKLVIPIPSSPPAASSDITDYLNVTATSSGSWANGLEFRVTSSSSTSSYFTVSIGRKDAQGNFVPSEVYTDVSFDPSDTGAFVGNQINGVSTLVKVDAVALSSILASDKQVYMVGSLMSGDLAGSLSAYFAGLLNGEFSVSLDGDATHFAPVKLSTAPANLGDVAAAIQTQVRVVGATMPTALQPSYNDFTCSVENGKLVLRSGAKSSAAAVGVSALATPTTGLTPAAFDATATLKLDAGAATSQTGDQAFVATFSGTSTAVLANGAIGSLPIEAEYTSLTTPLKKYRDISIILLPGQTWKSGGNAIIDAFRAHAETMKNRMLIIDPDDGKVFNTSVDFAAEGFPTSTYTAAYYPWLEVSNPCYHPELRKDRARTVHVPPSGFAAGLWAKTDGRRGVWKAPAGLQASLIGAANTVVKIGDDEQDQLNPVGLNCYRRIISDIVIWGSRTLATRTDPEWRYVPVRRTAMMIEESVYQGIQWAVFEPNDHRLWSALRLNIGVFMDSLFRAGAFQGEKASDAYFVRCGKDDTMTQGDIDAGQVIVMVGFAPVKPAEFVIVRIQQIVGKQ